MLSLPISPFKVRPWKKTLIRDDDSYQTVVLHLARAEKCLKQVLIACDNEKDGDNDDSTQADYDKHHFNASLNDYSLRYK